MCHWFMERRTNHNESCEVKKEGRRNEWDFTTWPTNCQDWPREWIWLAVIGLSLQAVLYFQVCQTTHCTWDKLNSVDILVKYMLTDLRTEDVGVQTEISGLRWVGWTMNEWNLFCFILSLTWECQVYVKYLKKEVYNWYINYYHELQIISLKSDLHSINVLNYINSKTKINLNCIITN